MVHQGLARVKKQLELYLEQSLKEKIGEAQVTLEIPPSRELGDFSLPCFKYAKVMRKAPPLIAKEFAALIPKNDLLSDLICEQGYLNFRLSRPAIAAMILDDVLSGATPFGSKLAPLAEHWMVEYSGPNTNKPLHLGHLRNNCLGFSLAAILEFYGYRVTRINIINDRGIHICKSMLAYQLFGEGQTPEKAKKKGDHLVGDYYVLFEKKFQEEYKNWQTTVVAAAAYENWRRGQKDAQTLSREEFFKNFADRYFNEFSVLGKQAKQMLNDWEAGEPKVRALWQTMNTWVLAGFSQTYKRMGVHFEQVQYESDTYQLGKKIVEAGLQQGLLYKLADGAVAFDLTRVGLTGEKILLRKDGSSVYMTGDLGTATERFAKFAIDHLVYVVADEQNYHFEVLFKILAEFDKSLTGRCHHLSYGMVRLPEGKMKSREGTVVDADDLLDTMVALAKEETVLRQTQGKAHTQDIVDAELEHRADCIGQAALKYYLLRFTPPKSFEYDPKASIDFYGQTGPYCLFNYARTCSLLKRAPKLPPLAERELSLLVSDAENEIIYKLAEFPEIIERAATQQDPSRLAEYIYELARLFAYFFTDKEGHPIVTCENQPLQFARLTLVAAVREVLGNGLKLLGIEKLDEM